MDCSEFCANFKPKSESPFPNTLRTADLHKGMLVEDNYGLRMVIIEPLDGKRMRVFEFGSGYARENKVSLADRGCQPYNDGRWNQSNWLREVK